MRYFFISYSHDKGFGNMTLILEEFPSQNAVDRTVKEQYPNINSVAILYIYEFRNKEDFDRFNGN